MDFEKLDEIVAADEVVRYVGIVDSLGNIINSRTKKDGKIVNDDDEELFRIDLLMLRNMLDVFENSFGKTIAIQTRREKINQLIYYHDYMIICVTCNPNLDSKKMAKVSEKIEPLIQKLVS